MNQPTPIRHGDWRVINGELVDFSQTPPPPPASPEPAPAESAKPAPFYNGPRNRFKR